MRAEVLRRLIWPSACPLLEDGSMALLTASLSPQLIDVVGAASCFFRIAGSGPLEAPTRLAL